MTTTSRSTSNPRLLTIPPFRRDRQGGLTPYFARSTICFPCGFFNFPIHKQNVVFHGPLTRGHDKGSHPMSFFLVPRVVHGYPFIQISRQSHSFLCNHFVLQRGLRPATRYHENREIHPPLSHTTFSNTKAANDYPRREYSFYQHPENVSDKNNK